MFDDSLVSSKTRHAQLIDHFNIHPIEPECQEEYIKIPIDLPWEDLKKDTQQAFDKFGWFGMVHRMRSDWTRSQMYGGLGLTYNPDYAFNLDEHAHCWGQPRSIRIDFDPDTWINCLQNYDYSKFRGDGVILGKNTYDDPLGLRYRTPVTHYKSLSSIFDKIKRPLFQGRIAEIKAREYGHLTNKEKMEMAWHTDEKNEIVSRLLIPIDFSEDYYIEFKETGNRIYFEKGYAYHWNTYKIHRWNFDYHKEIQNRTCIVIGWSPWLDFENKRWSTNEYCGKIHPMDMLLEGLVI